MIVHNCEQGTEEWRKLRIGIPTASQFHRILTPKRLGPSSQQNAYIDELIAERLTGEPHIGESSGFTERGTDMEEEARFSYEAESAVTVHQPGFITNDEGTIGCSPDGMVFNKKGSPIYGLEIKCPAAKTHVHYMTEGSGTNYRGQLQGSMLVAGLKEWEFYSFNPAMTPYIERVHRDREFIERLNAELQTFLGKLEGTWEQLGARGLAPDEPYFRKVAA